MGALGASSFLGTGGALAQRFDLPPNVFGRMFPGLDPFFEEASDALNRELIAIGKRGGVMDAGDKLPDSSSPADQAAAAMNLIVDQNLSRNNPNTTHTAGTTFMGQFMDHDMTFDQTSALGEETDPKDPPRTRQIPAHLSTWTQSTSAGRSAHRTFTASKDQISSSRLASTACSKICPAMPKVPRSSAIRATKIS
jgi:hypothetical protein